MQGDGLEAHHQISIPSEVDMKKAMASDLRLIFSNRVTVHFNMKNGHVKVPVGRWCNVCK